VNGLADWTIFVDLVLGAAHASLARKSGTITPKRKTAQGENPLITPPARSTSGAANDNAVPLNESASNVVSLETRRKQLVATQSRSRRSSKQRQLASGDRETIVANSSDENILGFSLEEGRPISAEDNLDIRRTRTVRTTEYNPRVGDSNVLGRRLQAVGRKKPSDGYEAHHIIPSKEEAANKLRDLLRNKGIDINHPDNGVWLSRGSQTGNISAEYKHEFTFQDHPEYFERLEEIFLKNSKITKKQIIDKLRKIGEYLEAGKLPPSNL
jgi:hypothetical protein